MLAEHNLLHGTSENSPPGPVNTCGGGALFTGDKQEGQMSSALNRDFEECPAGSCAHTRKAQERVLLT